MKKLTTTLALIGTLSTAPVVADHDSSFDAAIGGGLGGAVGAYLGNELGGREGAIIGGALGAAGGAAIATDRDRYHRVADHHDHRYYGDDDEDHYYHSGYHGHGRFCPPGLAKKGRC